MRLVWYAYTHTCTYWPRHKTRCHNIHALHHGHFPALFFTLSPALASTLSTEFCHLHVLCCTARSMLNSFFGPTLSQRKTISITNCFLATTLELTENTQSGLYCQNIKVSRYKCACNCIYVHKVEVRTLPAPVFTDPTFVQQGYVEIPSAELSKSDATFTRHRHIFNYAFT
jgi:hypothetical protein